MFYARVASQCAHVVDHAYHGSFTTDEDAKQAASLINASLAGSNLYLTLEKWTADKWNEIDRYY